MNEENIVIAYKISENDRKILEKISNKTKEPFNIMVTNEPEDIIPIPSAFMAFVNLENEINEKDKKYVLKNVNDVAEYMNSIIIDENTFTDEEKLIKLINKNYAEYYKQTEWYKLEDDYNELTKKIRIYQKVHSLKEDDYTFSELDLLKYFNDEWGHVSKCIVNCIKREILFNNLLDYIDFNHKHISPILYKNINKGIFQLFLDYYNFSPYPIKYKDEKEQEENPRMIEIKQLAKLCDILAEEIYIEKYDKSIGNNRIEFMVKYKKDNNITDEHLIACRISKDNVIFNLMQYVQEVIITSLVKENKDFSKKNLFKYKFSDELWENIKTVVKNFAALPLWKNRNVFLGTYFTKTWRSILETGKTEDEMQLLQEPVTLTKLLNNNNDYLINKFTKAIVLDLDETLIHGYCDNNTQIMLLRPNIDKLIEKLQEVKKKNVDVILCTTSKNDWVNKFFELKPIFRNIFDKIYTRDNEKEWRYFNEEIYPLEYSARCKNVNLEYLKPITTFGYNQILYIDDNKLEATRLQILFDLTQGKLNKDITFFTGFKFYRKSIIWEKMLDYNDCTNKNLELNKKLEEYLKFEENNPGCNMMVSAINTFINKPFKSGLSIIDEIYSKEYKQYDKKLLQLQEEIQQLIEQGQK